MSQITRVVNTQDSVRNQLINGSGKPSAAHSILSVPPRTTVKFLVGPLIILGCSCKVKKRNLFLELL